MQNKNKSVSPHGVEKKVIIAGSSFDFMFLPVIFLDFIVCMCSSDETLNRGPMFREMSRPVHVKDPSST
jgi:hypothetical protein